jgi:hypothetical protein
VTDPTRDLGPSFGMERLPFRLPEFVRLSWVGDDARRAWEPRFRRLAEVLSTLQWSSVRAGLRRACKLVLTSAEARDRFADRLAPDGLVCETVQPLAASPYHGAAASPVSAEPGHLLVAIGRPDDASLLKGAILAFDLDAEQALLGAGACCRAAFAATWRDARFADFTWPMAARTIGRAPANRAIEIDRPSLVNPLWKWVGIRLLFTIPCRFDCPAALRSADELARLGDALGHGQEMAWAREILSWPLEWSALHGIAEIRTPVCKLVVTTDATPRRYAVRVHGDRLPDEGASGLSFPYDFHGRARDGRVAPKSLGLPALHRQ